MKVFATITFCCDLRCTRWKS